MPKEFNIGDSVKHPEYGKGKCYAIDPESKFMRYFLKFEDGTVAWFSVIRAENELTLVS